MKRLLLALLMLLPILGVAQSGPNHIPTLNTYTAHTLPAAPNNNTIAFVSDGATNVDCSVGGGANTVLCVFTNSAWMSLSQAGINLTLPSTPISANGYTAVAQYSGSDWCAQVKAASVAHPGAILDARTITGTPQCTSGNPFASQTADIVLLLAPGTTVQTTQPWVSNSNFNTIIVGTGRGSNGRGSTIQAVAGFPATCDGLASECPILRLGNGTTAFAQRFENATLDCNGVSGCTGLYSTDIQEQSGLVHFSILNYLVHGILIDGSSNVGTGPFWAQNYQLSDGEVYALNDGLSTTVGVKLIGGNNSAGGETAPRIVENVTASGNAGHVILAAYQFEQFWGGLVMGLNAENAVTGYQFGVAQPMNGVTGMNLRCANVSTNCVWITSNSPFTNNLTLFGIQNTPTVATNTIRDDMRGKNTLGSTDPTVGIYMIGNGLPGGGFTFFSSTSATGGIEANGLTLFNNMDASQNMFLNAGVTADQVTALQFQSKGVNTFNVQSTAAKQFLIFNNALNHNFFWFNPSDGNTYWNSESTGAANINAGVNSGTGGFNVWSGGASPVDNFTVSSAGAVSAASTITSQSSINAVSGYKFNSTAGFTGTKTAGTCVLTIQGGIITNVTGC